MKIKQINFKVTLLLISVAVAVMSCTNLEVSETDSIFSEATGTFSGVEDVDQSITNIYNNLRGQIEAQDNFYALSEVSTDELLVPTRGTDWGDNGIWRVLHQHTWPASHTYVLNVWNQMNQNAFFANEILHPASGANAQQAAKAKFLRAFSMWMIMDLYGQVPFREADEGPEINPRILTRTEALDFVLQDLNDAIPNLPSVGPGANTEFASKAAAYFLKARVLLNAGIYRGEGSPSSGDMPGVIAAVDALTAEGFGLQSGNYFDIFTQAGQGAETVWFTKASTGNRMWNGLHYHQVAPGNDGGGWNGFTTLAEFYDLFEGNPTSNYVGDGQEDRRGWVPDNTNAGPSNAGLGFGFLIGQQYNASGVPLKDRPGNPLVFTKELPGLVGNNERTGIRVLKYHPVNGAFAGHVLIFRYADAYLMKAEAMMRSGSDATSMVNTLRVMRGASPLGSVTESNMIDERGRELYNEMVRRTDLIRFGQFTKDWQFKNPDEVGNEARNLYPIPANAILSNPNLVQNPGY